MRTSSLDGFLTGLGTGGTTGDAATDEARPAAADEDGGQIACNSCSHPGEVDQVQETGKKSAARLLHKEMHYVWKEWDAHTSAIRAASRDAALPEERFRRAALNMEISRGHRPRPRSSPHTPQHPTPTACVIRVASLISRRSIYIVTSAPLLSSRPTAGALGHAGNGFCTQR